MATVGFSQANVSPAVAAYSDVANALATARYRLSSGTRIRHAGDDSSAVSTATRLQAQSSALRGTLHTSAYTTTYLQVAAEGIARIHDVLSNLTRLAASAADGQRSSNDFAYLQASFAQGLARIDPLVASTRFNGSSILDGSMSGSAAPTIITGTTAGDSIALPLADLRSSALFSGALPSIDTTAHATAAIAPVASALQAVATARAQVTAYQERIDTAGITTRGTLHGVHSAVTSLLATDIAAETITLTTTTLKQAATALRLAQALGFNSDLLGLVSGRG
ncbi:MAG: hypothetical protein V4735_04930 [Pseudomonadota bacterium]